MSSGKRAKNFFDGKRHANDARGADGDFLGPATEMTSRLLDGFHRGSVADRAGGAVGVACINNHGAHAALRSFQMRLGNDHGRGNHKVLREDSRGGSRHIARKQGQIESAGFFQAAGGARRIEIREAAPLRKGLVSSAGGSAGRTRTSRKGPPILRMIGGRFDDVDDGAGAHGVSPSFGFLCRDFLPDARWLPERNLAVPPGTALDEMAAFDGRVCRKSSPK